MDAKTVIERGNDLYAKRGSLVSLWQTLADEFYPERADFTITRSLGTDFAAHLTTSYPIILRRDLGNSFSSMLRSTAVPWFAFRAEREEYEDHAALEWLERATGTARRAMYDKNSLLTRATKEGDHDFATFGQAALTAELNALGNGLLYRCWHLRDVAWCENEEGKIDTVHRKWKAPLHTLAKLFGNKSGSLHESVTQRVKDKPYEEIECRHIVMPGAEYKPEFARFPFVSLYIDVENKHVMQERGQSYFMYVIPRWQTVSGSQYAFSPATVAGLPDARLLQDMSRVLLEAGEKATNPPMIAVKNAIRSDIAIYAGGVTWVDDQYDEKLGEVLRPLTSDKSGLPVGIDMQRDIRAMLKESFFLNTLTLPQNGPEMTAYEVGQRIQEYIRQAAPIFEPMEDEYNGALVETTFQLMLAAGAFGPTSDIPESLRGREVTARFESPLHEAIERQKGQKFQEVKAILADTLALDPGTAAEIDIREAFRDVITSIGTPQKWLRSEQEANDIRNQQAEQKQAQELIQQIGAGAEAAKSVGEAGQAFGPDAMAA